MKRHFCAPGDRRWRCNRGILSCAAAEGPLDGGNASRRSRSWLDFLRGPARPTGRSRRRFALKPQDDLLDACGWRSSSPFMPTKRAIWRASTCPGRRSHWRVSESLIASLPERRRLSRAMPAALPWKEAPFNAVTCMECLPVFTAPEQVLAEVLRVLRPGGRMPCNRSEGGRTGCRGTCRTRPATRRRQRRGCSAEAGRGCGVRRDLDLLWPVFGEHRLGTCESPTGESVARLVGP